MPLPILRTWCHDEFTAHHPCVPACSVNDLLLQRLAQDSVSSSCGPSKAVLEVLMSPWGDGPPHARNCMCGGASQIACETSQAFRQVHELKDSKCKHNEAFGRKSRASRWGLVTSVPYFHRCPFQCLSGFCLPFEFCCLSAFQVPSATPRNEHATV